MRIVAEPPKECAETKRLQCVNFATPSYHFPINFFLKRTNIRVFFIFSC